MTLVRKFDCSRFRNQDGSVSGRGVNLNGLYARTPEPHRELAKMEGESEPAAAAAVFSAVLDDDDLLGEILARVAFPTSFVRAALVCKRWLRLASAPAFLRRFGDLHSPSLLGFYVVTRAHASAEKQSPQFVPVPQPPELAAVARRASFNLDSLRGDWLRSEWFDLDCRNGLVHVFHGHGHPEVMVRSPLCPATYTAVLPPVPSTSIHDGFTYYYHDILANGGGQSYFCLALGSKEQQPVWDVYVLQGDTWAIYSSVVPEIQEIALALNSLISHDKMYNLALVSGTFMLVLLDLPSSSLSLVSLPEEVEYKSTGMSLANDDSGVHLIHVKGSHLRIWLYDMTDKKGLADWLLVDTICLREICVHQMISTRMFDDVGDPSLMVREVGVDSGFLFLEADGVLYLFDIKRKELKKVYEVTQEDRYLYGVTPFMMVWPPKFPVMKEGCDPKE
ncbi:hypothetical protein CFC21_111336 [Triticum aestivum]|uniref:F-box protein AT5G49610-like beta-propeller domain-containing protein n=2 Tax=Triticum aestivum TaxID=4565 RepID=A0A9R1NEX9_WHEAT|nr:uncharacterized protein LOC123166657 [Triticum aestivum]KAF7111312.1 hypothetical protein CFC21_111336 [Triticum aestivum]